MRFFKILFIEVHRMLKPLFYLLQHRLFFPLILFGGIFSLFACGDSHQDHEVSSKELNLLTYTDYIPDKVIKYIEDEYAITIHQTFYENTEEAMEIIQKNPYVFDVMILSEQGVKTMRAKDALMSMDKAELKYFNNLDPKIMDFYSNPKLLNFNSPNDLIAIPFFWGTTGIIYDTSKVKDPVTSWEDLWRPEFKNKLHLLNDPSDMIGITLITQGHERTDPNPSNIEKAIEKLRTLKDNIHSVKSYDLTKIVNSGDVNIAVVFNGDAQLIEDENPNMKYILPSEGALVWYDSLVISKHSRNLDAAYAFIDDLLSIELAGLILKQYPYSTPNRALLDHLKATHREFYNQYMNSPITNPSEEDIRVMHYTGNSSKMMQNIYLEFWKNFLMEIGKYEEASS